MKTLSDLTLPQLTAIFSVVSGKTVGAKFFNGRAKALSRLEALLAEKNLTIAQAMCAAGIETDEQPNGMGGIVGGQRRQRGKQASDCQETRQEMR